MRARNPGSDGLVRALGLVIVLVWGIVVTVPTVSAQSAALSSVIHGIVKDETGGALPGVTVTLKSPALQVAQRVAITGEDGSYRFGELAGGIYNLTFELAGFTKFVRDELSISINFTARVDATMGVGKLEETMTVSGASPVVDLTSSGTATNIVSEALQQTPLGRDIWMVMDMAPGVSRQGAPDVGGSLMASRPSMQTFGVTAQPKLDVEGINIVSGGDSNSAVYFNSFGLEEVQFQTSGTDAEMGTPGVHMVAVLKSGGNQFHGQYEGSYQGAKLQSDNLTASLRAQGLSETEPLRYHFDLAADLGGPIIREKLWFYGGYNTQNRQSGLLGFASGPGADGKYLTGDEPLADFHDTLWGVNVKGTWQASRANRFIGVYMKGVKLRPEQGADRFRPLEATRAFDNTGFVKKGEWQSTINNQMLVNVVFGTGGYFGDYSVPRSEFNPGTPSILHRESGLRTGGGEASDQRPRDNMQFDGSFSYFPEKSFAGHHELKTGAAMYRMLHGTGLLNHDHGNYTLVYDGSQPVEIQIVNYPVIPRNRVHTLAWFLKDSWRMSDRVTANLGVRFEHQTPFIPAQSKEASPQFPQLFPAGDFPKQVLLTWNRFLPRAGVAWSLNDRTVVKMSAGVYNYVFSDTDVNLYNLNALRTATYRWSDPDRNGDYTPGEVDLRLTGGNDFLNISSPANRRFNTDLVQPSTTEVTASFERELLANLGMRVAYVFRNRQDYYSSPGPNELRPRSVYNIALSRRDPGPDDRLGTADDGGRVMIYDFDAAYRGATFVRNAIVNSPNDDKIQTLEFAVNKRLSNRWSLQSSFWVVKNNRWIELNFESPNADYFPKDETWDWAGNLSGSYMLPGDVRISGFLQSKVGAKGARTNIFRATDPDGGTPLRQLATVTLRMEEFGSQQAPALTTINLRGGKDFRLGGGRVFTMTVDVFNLMNKATPSGISWASGTSFGYVTEVLPPRVVRFGGRFNF